MIRFGLILVSEQNHYSSRSEIVIHTFGIILCNSRLIEFGYRDINQ
jgi:hypothetical protein